ncbi:hypothetical protein PYCC9005_003324 [Savitreella phatthalungensis]
MQSSPRPGPSQRRSSATSIASSTGGSTVTTSGTITGTPSSNRRERRGGERRRALREFYGIETRAADGTELKDQITTIESSSNGPSGSTIRLDPILDSPDFDLEVYLAKLNKGEILAVDDAGHEVRKGVPAKSRRDSSPSKSKLSIKALLELENALISDIRTLGGERRALVYDNYDRMLATRAALKDAADKLDGVLTSHASQLTSLIDSLVQPESPPESVRPSEGLQHEIVELALKTTRRSLSRAQTLANGGKLELARDELAEAIACAQEVLEDAVSEDERDSLRQAVDDLLKLQASTQFHNIGSDTERSEAHEPDARHDSNDDDDESNAMAKDD